MRYVGDTESTEKYVQDIIEHYVFLEYSNYRFLHFDMVFEYFISLGPSDAHIRR